MKIRGTDTEKFCTNKIRYADRTAAHEAIIALVTQRKQRNLHSYRCPKCGGWHITSKSS